MEIDKKISEIINLDIWQNKISIAPLVGGLTNTNYLVEDGLKKYVVRVGGDIPEHHVMGFNVIAACKAAHAAGLSPAVLYAKDDICIIDYIKSHTLSVDDICEGDYLAKIVPLIRDCHNNVAKQFIGPALIFWVFHVIENYAAKLIDVQYKNQNLVVELQAIGNQLEQDSGPFDITFCHNDLLAANFLDDGKRLWLIDWDYAGYNTPLFDLGGLASNNNLTYDQEIWMLETYFEEKINHELLHQYTTMKCASLLRETMWAIVSQLNSNIDFNYEDYAEECLENFRKAYREFIQV
ncbi:MAG: phosphotransferase [Alphaproteobacteria bacterium]|nr:phosphotransferase [Alphaproteobacteria bacterium]